MATIKSKSDIADWYTTNFLNYMPTLTLKPDLGIVELMRNFPLRVDIDLCIETNQLAGDIKDKVDDLIDELQLFSDALQLLL